MAAPSTTLSVSEELIIEVLSLLTVKSLIRMKCVCKSWKTLISDPFFVQVHLKKSKRTTNFLLGSYRSSNLTYIVPISFECNGYSQFDTNELSCIIGSCNGLICLVGKYSALDYREYSFYIWNPATRTKSKRLGSFISYCRPDEIIAYDKIRKFTFGYDKLSNTYKVVFFDLKRDGNVVRTVVSVLPLGDNVWKNIDCNLQRRMVFYPYSSYENNGVYLSNNVNWLVRQPYTWYLWDMTIKEYVIISLDLGTETYNQLSLPQCCNEDLLVQCPILSILMDCLCFFYNLNNTHVVIWQMKEFGVEESWSQLFKICYMNLRTYYQLDRFDAQLIPSSLSENGDTLMFVTNRGQEAILYDWRNNRAKRIKSKEGVMWYNAKGYVESLVSIC